jgi:predicted metalloendopeptidase
MKNSLKLLITINFYRLLKTSRNKMTLSGIDFTMRPGDDFFRYVNGRYDSTFPIKPG